MFSDWQFVFRKIGSYMPIGATLQIFGENIIINMCNALIKWGLYSILND